MKKYKLIKEYPCSPKLGDIATKQGPENNWYRINGNSGHIRRDVDKYPEFWEEVIEKDYEIITLISTTKSKMIIDYKNGGGCYAPGEFESLYKDKEEWLKIFSEYAPSLWKIHSIKRLSDGEIFTIDEHINCNSWFGKIIKFEIIDNEIRVFMAQNVHPNKIKPNYLKDCRKIKKPLFRTEDGVDIFEGDNVYQVRDGCGVLLHKVNHTIATSYSEYDSNKIKFMFFSNEQKAEEYILENSPCISYKEIFDNLHFGTKNNRDHARNVLMGLVKFKQKK